MTLTDLQVNGTSGQTVAEAEYSVVAGHGLLLLQSSHLQSFVPSAIAPGKRFMSLRARLPWILAMATHAAHLKLQALRFQEIPLLLLFLVL
jgi:hypothetical protein